MSAVVPRLSCYWVFECLSYGSFVLTIRDSDFQIRSAFGEEPNSTFTNVSIDRSTRRGISEEAEASHSPVAHLQKKLLHLAVTLCATFHEEGGLPPAPSPSPVTTERLSRVLKDSPSICQNVETNVHFSSFHLSSPWVNGPCDQVPVWKPSFPPILSRASFVSFPFTATQSIFRQRRKGYPLGDPGSSLSRDALNGALTIHRPWFSAGGFLLDSHHAGRPSFESLSDVGLIYRIRPCLSSGGWATVITNLESKKVERTCPLVLGDCRLIGEHSRFPRLRSSPFGHPRTIARLDHRHHPPSVLRSGATLMFIACEVGGRPPTRHDNRIT